MTNNTQDYSKEINEMCKINEQLFKEANVIDNFTFDKSLSNKDACIKKLADAIKTFYNTKNSLNVSEHYWNWITNAIMQNSLENVSLLWSGIYYYDRDTPNFGGDLLTAAKFGNLETFKYVLHGYLNFTKLHETESIKRSNLKELSKNDEVLKLIDTLPKTIKTN